MEPWTHGAMDPWTHGPMDPWTHGPMDPCTHGPMDPWTHGPMDPWTHGPMDPWTHGPMDPRTHGPMDPWTHGPMDPWTHGPMDPWTHGPMDPWTHREEHCGPGAIQAPRFRSFSRPQVLDRGFQGLVLEILKFLFSPKSWSSRRPPALTSQRPASKRLPQEYCRTKNRHFAPTHAHTPVPT